MTFCPHVRAAGTAKVLGLCTAGVRIVKEAQGSVRARVPLAGPFPSGRQAAELPRAGRSAPEPLGLSQARGAVPSCQRVPGSGG